MRVLAASPGISSPWNRENDTDLPAKVESHTGNFYFIVPAQLANRVASAFNPTGTYKPDGALGPLYAVECDATLPSNVSIESGGKGFEIDNEDLIYRDFDGECYSTFALTVPLQGIELFFLSRQFLRNMVAVFDYQHNEMRFAERIRNASSVLPSSPQPTVPTQGENEAPFIYCCQPMYLLSLLLLAFLVGDHRSAIIGGLGILMET